MILGYDTSLCDEDIATLHQELGVGVLHKFVVEDAYLLELPDGMSVEQALATYSNMREQVLFAEPNYRGTL
ncbi:MAG: hypothetical protein HN348_23130 [Proteobacteria bacterium]|nr:hypothetical protein [Pseudomonadota bacterium]